MEVVMTTIGYVLAGLLGLGIIVLGVRFHLVPTAAAAGYGVPIGLPGARPERPVAAYLDIKAIRDIVSGLVVLVLIVAQEPTLLAWVLLVETLTPLADAGIVLRHGGSRAQAYGIHGTTVVVMLITVALLLL
jgi:hypothetical protein